MTHAAAFYGLALISLVPLQGNASIYYVAPGGNDANGGSFTSPLRTLAKAASMTGPGDIVDIRAGDYQESLNPRNSGLPGQLITFRAHTGETVIISGSAANEPAAILNASYVALQRLRIHKALTPAGRVDLTDILVAGNHNLLQRCQVLSGRPSEQVHASGVHEEGIGLEGSFNTIDSSEMSNMTIGIALRSGNHNKIRNNNVHDSYLDAIRLGAAQSGSNLIEGNRLWGSRISDGIQFNPPSTLPAQEQLTDTSNCRVVIRGNSIYANAENGIDLKGACNVVIDGNSVFGSRGDNDGAAQVNPSTGSVNDRGGGRAIMHGSFRKSRDVIIRRNVIYDNDGAVLLNDEGWVVYQNTIVANNRDFTGPDSDYFNSSRLQFVGIEGYAPGNNAVKNNIIGDHSDAEVALPAFAHAEIDGNLYFHSLSPAGFAQSSQPWRAIDFSAWRSLLLTFAAVTARDAKSQVVVDPKFVRAPPRPTLSMADLDFHLRADSPAIDLGVALTSTIGSGSGILLRVRQARYFSDGLDIVPGDRIRIGGRAAAVIAVDYATGTLTLSNSIAWRDGDPVCLDYHGAAPDAGAFEFTGEP